MFLNLLLKYIIIQLLDSHFLRMIINNQQDQWISHGVGFYVTRIFISVSCGLVQPDESLLVSNIKWRVYFHPAYNNITYVGDRFLVVRLSSHKEFNTF